MSENIDIPGFEQRVRDRAYAMWENEGRPFGRHVEHWRLSEAATIAELTTAARPKKAAKTAAGKRGRSAPKRGAAAAQMSAGL